MCAFDTNDDNQINLGDAIESEHLQAMVEYCDMNDD
jgi:hypothetical protein